jgi:hypothetical protein
VDTNGFALARVASASRQIKLKVCATVSRLPFAPNLLIFNGRKCGQCSLKLSLFSKLKIVSQM